MSEAPATAAELWKYLRAAKSSIDQAFADYDAAIVEDANADRAMKQQLASADATLRTQLDKPTVDEMKARVNQATGDIQHRARLAESRKKACHLKVQSDMQWLSSLQSYASLSKAEAQLAKWEPSEVSA